MGPGGGLAEKFLDWRPKARSTREKNKLDVLQTKGLCSVKEARGMETPAPDWEKTFASPPLATGSAENV